MKSKTILNDEPFLRQISKEVTFDDVSYLEDIEVLKQYCLENKNVFAMAAIQLGIPKRIIYLQKTTLDIPLEYSDEVQVLINPVILSRKGHTRFWEACVSCLDNMGLVDRPYEIDVEYQNESGNKHIRKFVGFEATVLSHEYDHLNGVLHIDIASEIVQMQAEERKEFRKVHLFEIISKDCDFDKIERKTSINKQC